MAASRFWDVSTAFADPVTVAMLGVIAGLFVVAPFGIVATGHGCEPALARELWSRTRSWAVIALVVLVPITLGPGWTILGFTVLAIACYREFARATGLFRERLTSACVAIGILLVAFAAFDAWYGFFLALAPLGMVLVAAATIPLDRPSGYIQRTALGIFGFVLFGPALLHLAYLANATHYRPLLLLILIAVGLNDVFAFVVGKAIGGAKLVPATSPNKTVSGALGAVVLTTAVVTLAAGPVFAGTGMAGLAARIGLGLVIAVVGQAGDLMLSSIKRDLGIKDTGAVIPGHGGVLDRCNSLLLVAPAAFHYLKAMDGLDLGGAVRVVTGGG